MIILASKSAVRSQLLRTSGVDHRVMASPYNEDAAKHDLPSHTPDQVASRLASGKALAVSAIHPDHLVIGADQTLEFKSQLINKCQSISEARLVLNQLRGNTHHLHASISVSRGNKILFGHTASVTLKMRAFTDHFLDAYLKEEAPHVLTSVGCYHYEGRGIQLFESVAGDYHAILGLPVLPLLAFLREIGELHS